MSRSPVTVTVHWADPAQAADGMLELLDDHERFKHARFVRPADRDRYLVAHALVRILLGARERIHPQSLSFDRTCSKCGAQHGKPVLIASQVAFSLSHSGGRVVVAVCDGYPVGVDVETVGTANGLATELLDPWELDRLPDGAGRDAALTTWWARKEALLKSTGDGLSVDPRRVRVSTPDAQAQVLAWQGAPARRIALCDLQPGRGYCAALAVVTDLEVHVSEHDSGPLIAEFLGGAGDP